MCQRQSDWDPTCAVAKYIAVLYCCCEPWSATSGRVISGVSCLETVLQAINSGDMHTQNDGSLLWQLSSLRHPTALWQSGEESVEIMILLQIFFSFILPSLGRTFITQFHGTVCTAIHISAETMNERLAKHLWHVKLKSVS